MDPSGNRRRFPVFKELSDGGPLLSRALQVVCGCPERLVYHLHLYGPIESYSFQVNSVMVVYRCLSDSAQAYEALKTDYRVFYCSEPRVPANCVQRHSFSSSEEHSEGRMQENLFHDNTLTVESEESTRTSPMPLSSSSSREEEKSRRRLRKMPIQEGERRPFLVSLPQVLSGEDERTTLMIRHIPNKYTRKMLLQKLDQHFPGTYDFFYLPIDFKNKCNVGFAFLNVLVPRTVAAVHSELHGKKWEKFQSEKVCEISYARIQGQAALITHFESSSIMSSEDSKIKPFILFH